MEKQKKSVRREMYQEMDAVYRQVGNNHLHNCSIRLHISDEAPDLLMWEELGKLQIQPRLYQIVEVCEKISDAKPYLIRLCYTSPKVPHRVLVHYLGDTRPYLIKDYEIIINDYTGEPSYRVKGEMG